MSNLFVRLVAALVISGTISSTANAQVEADLPAIESFTVRNEEGAPFHWVVIDQDGFAGSVTLTHIDGEPVTIITNTEQSAAFSGWDQDLKTEFLSAVVSESAGKQREEEEQDEQDDD